MAIVKTLLCLLTLSLCACQTAAQRGAQLRADAAAAWAANHSTRTISVHSVPSGAVVDLNGSHIGTTPFTHQLDKCYRGGWPLTGHVIQTLRARWLDGTVQHDFHPVGSRPPEKVLFMHPNALAYARQSPPKITQN